MVSFFRSVFCKLKQHKTKLLLFCFIAISVFTVWYHFPIKILSTTTAVSADGEDVSVTMSLTFYRFFFKPTEAEGTITVNGTKYVDLKTKGIPFSNAEERSFFTGIKEKYSGITYFIFSDAAVSKSDAISHRLQIVEIDSEAGEIVIHYIENGESGYYYLSDKQFQRLKL